MFNHFSPVLSLQFVLEICKPISGQDTICSTMTPQMIKEGKCVNYYKNGKVREEGNYHVNARKGLFKSYYEDGQLQSEIFYDTPKQKWIQYWSKTGEPLLANVSGSVINRNDEYQTTNYSFIKDSLLINAYSIKDGSTDTVYTFLEKQPEYIGGYQALIKDIQKNMTYPKSARRHGIEGIVYVQFIVDKQGNVIEPVVLRGIQRECDEVALNAVSKLKQWEPGLANKKPVLVRFVLPVKFRLN